MRKHLCWLLGHSFICLFRFHWGTDRGQPSHREDTGWACQHCGKQRIERWDS